MSEGFNVIGIISIGEMGLGIARLLKVHDYEVATYAADRSEGTQARARSHGIILEPSIEDLVTHCDCILSIVPPRDAFTTAKRIYDVVSSPSYQVKIKPLYYLDLNAISPKSARKTEALFAPHSDRICLLDGGIIGGVPYEKTAASNGTAPETQSNGKPAPNWNCPSLMLSGPHPLPSKHLCEVLNIDYFPDSEIGAATGLKMCFAATTKGLYSLGIQAYTTAHCLGVMPELRSYLKKYNPAIFGQCENGIVAMPSKAYRWIGEMLEIAETMSEDGGFEKTLFQGVSNVYKSVAENPILGSEQPGNRKRGKTIEDVVELLSEGLDPANGSKRRRVDGC